MRDKKKCLNLLYTDSFIQLDRNLTKTIEGKNQRSKRKINNNLTNQEYGRLYPTESSREKFYGRAKQPKLKNRSSVNDLPLSMISQKTFLHD